MRKFLVVLLIAGVAGGAGYLLATRWTAPASPDQVIVRVPRRDRAAGDSAVRDEAVRVDASADPVEHALKALLDPPAGEHGTLPPKTRLLSLKVEDGIATVNLSSEFNELRQHGNTPESVAQNSLRRTLAQFPRIEKMLILVEGKPFESEHSDWSEPIPVRDSNAGAGGSP